jgi:Cof subfamily protein (haloacid dehalogenase superfamily)
VIEPATTTEPATTQAWLVALDIDGTVLQEDGTITDVVAAEIARVRDLGHEVMLATGRSVSMTLPVLDRLGIVSQYVVCANGAIVLRRDPGAPLGYARDHVETFDATEVLTTIRGHLGEASYAVEDAEGVFRYTGYFPDGALAVASHKVEFEELLGVAATRVVVISPEHGTEDFLAVVERMGLHKVTYNVGWTAWLDIAPDGVNKATGLERARAALGIPASRVFTAGDGRNDIDMFEWTAAAGGIAVAMGQAPDEVLAAATHRTGTDIDDGLADALSRHFQG